MSVGQFSLYLGVVLFWLSSWVPVPPDTIGTMATLGCVATYFIAVYAAATRPSLCQRPGRVGHWVAVTGLVVGAVAALLAGGIGTSGDVALTLFFAAGGAAFVALMSTVLRHAGSATWRLGWGGMLLVGLAAWSWVSAFSMDSQRGVEAVSPAACILLPSGHLTYDTQITSVWQMRLADFASTATGPTGTTILNYHAILVSPGNNPDLYNWSKLWLRFEPLSRVLNQPFPQTCP